ncbi:MAG: hypothetical protein KBG54_00375 [Oscillospiraceae bacterium]|jgi:hypothetical protein|nr:hypothetical protein [Oscillospiraceae bacterium]
MKKKVFLAAIALVIICAAFALGYFLGTGAGRAKADSEWQVKVSAFSPNSGASKTQVAVGG